MRIHYMSDLHLEFGPLEKPLPKGDIVILAGDITLTKILEGGDINERARMLRDNTLSLFDEAQRNFDKVIYLMGNHEHYGGCIDDSADLIRRFLPRATLLENDYLLLGDTILCGATLWTDMGAGDHRMEDAIRESMSDFYTIRKRTEIQPRAFRPSDARELFATSISYLGTIADENSAKKIVVATHHAPSYFGVSRATRAPIGALYTNLHNFIQQRPNICAWVHGHTHIQRSYQIGECRVFSNARGYAGREYGPIIFNPDRWFEV
jgi:hypothetical protein